MEEPLNPSAATLLLQQTLRSLCSHENSQWIYAVFWRILPRNFPPPKWDSHGGAYDRSRGNRRNWILVWEDGYCNFAASANSELQHLQGLQPEIFFKMSHEIYNFGEGLIGKVAADHNHKWIHNEPGDINLLSAWYNSTDSHPRTWEAQFQSGIKTIGLIAVREGVVQLGAMQKVNEDLSYVMMVRRKLSLIESIPGVLLPHPSSSAFPYNYPPLEYGPYCNDAAFNNQQSQMMMMKITPSMSSLENLLSKLPSVVPPPFQQANEYSDLQHYQHHLMPTLGRPFEIMVDKGEDEEKEKEGGECSSSMSSYHQQSFHYHQDLNSRPESGF